MTRRSANILAFLVVGAVLSAAMSLGVVIADTGVRGDLVGRWLRAWAIAFLIAVPTAMVLRPMLRRVVSTVSR